MSIGSDAVYAVEEYINGGRQKTGKTAIEQISRVYGAQVGVRVVQDFVSLWTMCSHLFELALWGLTRPIDGGGTV